MRTWRSAHHGTRMCMQAIQEVMPPVFSVEETLQALSTAHFPPPLDVAPLPPMIVTEKGESLDKFILRRHPDFFTAIQVRVMFRHAR